VDLVHNNNSVAVEASTLDWIQRVVVGLNLCPFAQAVVKSDDVKLVTEQSGDTATVLASLASEFYALSSASEQATVLFIMPNGFEQFDSYLDFLDLANALLEDLNFGGHLQLASFHPHYQFNDSEFNDAANFTNRSPYPMLHLLQESAVEKAVEMHTDTNAIPQRNIELLRAMPTSQLEQLVTGKDNEND